MCACLAVSVFPGLSILVPRLASRVTLAVRADARECNIYLSDARDVTHLSIYPPLRLLPAAATGR